MLVVALGGLGLAYAIDAAHRNNAGPAHRLDTDTRLTRSLGGRELSIPLSLFRYDEQRIEGFAKQIDLQLLLPLGRNNSLQPVEVTLLPRSRVRQSSVLLDGVYLHMFEDKQLTGPPGLVGKPLKAGAGYNSETVWYDALNAKPFVAKCSAPVFETVDARCLRAVYLGEGIGAVFSFSADLLYRWQDFDTEAGKWLDAIGAL